MASRPGARGSPEQIRQNVAALEHLTFSDDELQQIDEHAVESGIDLWQTAREEGRVS